jgi:hypothetical protein
MMKIYQKLNKNKKETYKIFNVKNNTLRKTK